MFKKVKIFNTGSFPQGEFNSERVSKIFENTAEKVVAQFAHTSKVKGASKEPLELGEFSNFILEDGNIYADIEFNEKGMQYYEDGTIKGVSVEISDDTINKVAILPIGVEPAISGAEFEEKGIMTFGGELEFEKTEEKTEEEPKIEEFAVKMRDGIPNIVQLLELLGKIDIAEEGAEFEMIKDYLWKLMDDKSVIDRVRGLGYDVSKPNTANEEFSKEEFAKEIENKIRAEFEAKSQGKTLLEELKSKGKVTKAMEDAGLNAEFMAAVVSKKNNSETLEFSENSYEFGKIFLDILEAIPAKNMNSEVEEFSKNKNQTMSPAEQLRAAKLI